MSDDSGFNVAFRYTRKLGRNGGYHGIITWTTFESEEAFNNWYTPEVAERQEVVEKGISAERAVELVEQTPFVCYLAAAEEDAYDEDGNFNMMNYRLSLDNAIFAERIRRGKIKPLDNKASS